MADFPYCTVPGKLTEFLLKIKDIGIPTKVTTKWLPTVGFGSTNDRSIITMLKFIGFIDNNGNPTESWKQYRGSGGGRALGLAIKSSYHELFQTYPNAFSRSSDDLKNFFRGHSTYGAEAVAKAVSTFQALSKNADFETSSIQIPVSPAASKRAVETEIPENTDEKPILPKTPSLHIDLNVHISPEASLEQIEKIFESMSKHLLK